MKKIYIKKNILSIIAFFSRKFHFKGMERILRFIYNPDLRVYDNFETIISYDKNLLIHINTASFIEWMTFFKGFYEREVTYLLKKYIQKDMVVVDIGANIGVHTLVMSNCVGDRGLVIAVEPHPTVYNRLKSNIEVNHLTNVSIQKVALSDQPGNLTLYGMNPSTPHHGISSLYKEHSADVLTEEIIVPVDTLDNIVFSQGLSRIDFIKIDTEGNDMRVLLGGRKSIEKFHPIILFEYDLNGWRCAGSSLDSMVSFFNELNYTLTTIEGNPISEIKDFDNVLAIFNPGA